MGSTHTGRPLGSSKVDVATLLCSYEKLARGRRRHRTPGMGILPSQDDLAHDLDVRSGRVTIRKWRRPEYFNLPWPPFDLDEPAWLVDAISPYEVLYCNAALCELTGYTSEQLLHRSSHVLRPRDAAAPEEAERLALAGRLKAGLECGTIVTYLLHKEGHRLADLAIQLRYGPASGAFFACIPRQMRLDQHLNVDNTRYIDHDGYWQAGLPPYVGNRLAS